MTNNKTDAEYYVLDSDWMTSTKPQHPDLAWGDYDDTPFDEAEPLEREDLPTPLQAEFDEPYPRNYEMVDLHKLSGQFACTAAVKQILEAAYGIQFFALDAIVDPKGGNIGGYYATHIWNHLDALDRGNTSGADTNSRGRLISVQRFSLDEQALQAIPLEQRLIFRLQDPSDMFILHESLAEKIMQSDLSGFMLERVDKWRAQI